MTDHSKRKAVPIALPSLEVQRRIVANVEALRAWGDLRLAGDPLLLERFRQQVLAVLIPGKLSGRVQ